MTRTSSTIRRENPPEIAKRRAGPSIGTAFDRHRAREFAETSDTGIDQKKRI
jgi:hypothetical protein